MTEDDQSEDDAHGCESCGDGGDITYFTERVTEAARDGEPMDYNSEELFGMYLTCELCGSYCDPEPLVDLYYELVGEERPEF